MERNEIVQRIRAILVSVLHHEDFEMKEGLKAFDVNGWDSLSHMIIITEIENDFKIHFKLKELNKLENLHSLIDLIQSKM